MKHIFIDFEMHPISKEYKRERQISLMEIIEFGAVMLDENYREISSFKEYVKPEYVKEMYDSVVTLTGITPGKLAGAIRFNEALRQFIKWCKSFDEEYIIYAWSSNDFEQVRKEMMLKNVKWDEDITQMMDRWIDFQKEYCELVNLNKVISLEKALNSIGIYFTGKIHDALWDARNTAELYRMTRNTCEFYGILSSIKSVLDNKDEYRSTLGDMFDFSAFSFA